MPLHPDTPAASIPLFTASPPVQRASAHLIGICGSGMRALAELLLDLNKQQETILIVVTHSAGLAAKFGARFELIERQLKQV